MTLTDREKEVLTAVSYGLTNDEIAGVLFLQPPTVKNYVTRLLYKLEVSNRTHLVRAGFEQKFLTVGETRPEWTILK